MTSYKCSKCDFSRGIKGYVTQHIKKTIKCKGAELIEDIVKVECEVCDKEFDNEELLKMHRKCCVQKKALVKIHYEDPDDINNKMDILTNLVTLINTKCEVLMEENKNLKKRIERLEGGIKIANDNKQRGYEELEEIDEDDENADISPCYSSTLDIFNPQKYKEILKKFDRKNYKQGKLITRFTGLQMVDKKGNIVDGIEASENGIFDGKKKYEYGDTTLLIKEVECPYPAKYRHFKTNECYCTKHFDLDTGKPLT